MRPVRHALVPLTLFCLASLGGSACLERELRPVVPCVSQGFVASIAQNAVDKVDLLFVVDDSPSMAEEQASLATNIPHLITVLATGDKNGDMMQDFPPVKDLHAGVITVNMGVGGIPNVPTCMRNADFGDDGVLITTPHVGGAGCMASYPHFLQFTAGTTNPMTFATDFTCLARTGTMGCGFEQQLDAPLKALLPASAPITFYSATHGHGDDTLTNGGFLRPDSLIVILDITDEDDCSTDQTDIWNPASATHTGDLNLRCINYFDQLYPVSRFIDGFKSLRPMNPNLVIFATITGVPEDLVTIMPGDTTVNYGRLFADPRMQNVIMTTGGTQSLTPACTATGRGSAAPGIRMAHVAEGFGENGVVQSICQADYGPALDIIISKIANALGNVCLPRKLNPDATNTVGCDVVEVFDPAAHPELDPGGANRCSLIPGADPTPARIDADGSVHCKIAQLPVDPTMRASGTAPTGVGWYYDDFSMDTLRACGVMMAVGSGQRIAFTSSPVTGSAVPLQGTTVNLECLQRVQGSGGGSGMTGASFIGAPCTMPGDPGDCHNDSGSMLHLFCDASARVCQAKCMDSSACPTSLVCDTTQPTPYCVNPICI